MLIPRLLVVSALIALCVSPLLAQDSQQNFAQAPSALELNGQSIHVQDFKFSQPVAGLDLPTDNPLAAPQANATDSDGRTCYSIRSYRVARVDKSRDMTKPAGESTCIAAKKFQMKAVLSFP